MRGTSQYTFNLLQNFPKAVLIIDVRPIDSYDVIHLTRSVNLPYDANYPPSLTVDSLKPFVRGDPSLFERRRRCVIVIVYSPPGIAFAREVEFILCKNKCREVHLLDVDFDQFAEAYHFVCIREECPKRRLPSCGFPSEILPFKLYIGDQRQATDRQVVQTLGISHILNITKSCRPKFADEGVTYLNVTLDDLETENITAHFSECYTFIAQALTTADNRVLVHCARGVSRSVTIVIMYLMRGLGLEYKEAFEWVKACREVACPNEGFVQQLVQIAL